MKLRYDPFPLILEQGDAATQLVCLVFFRLGDTRRALRCLLELLRDQHANGTFPSQLDRGQWGVQETVRHTLLLLETGFPAGRVTVAVALAAGCLALLGAFWLPGTWYVVPASLLGSALGLLFEKVSKA